MMLTMMMIMMKIIVEKNEYFTSIGLLYWLTSMPSLQLFVRFAHIDEDEDVLVWW